MLLWLIFLPLLNPIEALSDNKSYVTKINELTSNECFKLCMHKINKYEAYITLFAIISKHFTISYIKGHHDSKYICRPHHPLKNEHISRYNCDK